MGRVKKNVRRNVVCIRVSDAEKTVLDELTKDSSMSISNLMREALQQYLPVWENGTAHR
jgi:predicted transcriptional regulator